MKLITATARTQGQRDNDFHWCIDGELVMLPTSICARDRDDPDGGCGCGRSFGGLSSHLATTTAQVSDIEGFTRDDYVEAIRSSLEQQGWPTEFAADIADMLIDVASRLRTGAVIEYRNDYVIVRDERSETV